VLHCVIGALVVVGPQGVGFNGSEQHTELWRLTVTLLTDPRVRPCTYDAHLTWLAAVNSCNALVCVYVLCARPRCRKLRHTR
jgi:hypothetical protein